MKNTNAQTSVLFVVTRSNFGGAQHYVYDLATKLPRERYRVAVAFGGHGMLEEKLKEAGIRTISIPSLVRNVNPWKDALALPALISLFFRERPDIVHLNSSKAGGLGALAARIAGVRKIVFTVHGWAFTENRSVFARGVIWFLSLLTVLLVTDIITISKNARILSRKKTRLIPLGIAPESFPDIPDIIRSQFPERAIIVGMLAELVKNKGLEYAIRAVAAMQYAVHLAILGEGEERAALARVIAQCHTEDRVKLFGYIPDAARYLKGFDIVLLSSLKEGLPYVILEAGLAERAVIATRVGGVPDVIEDHATGLLVEPKDISGLARALDALAQDAALRTRLGKELKREVLAEFTLDRMVAETRRVYEDRV